MNGVLLIFLLSPLLMVFSYKMSRRAEEKGHYWSDRFWGRTTLWDALFYISFVMTGMLVMIVISWFE